MKILLFSFTLLLLILARVHSANNKGRLSWLGRVNPFRSFQEIGKSETFPVTPPSDEKNALLDRDTIRKLILSVPNQVIPAVMLFVTVNLLTKQILNMFGQLNGLSSNRVGDSEFSVLDNYLNDHFQSNVTFTPHELELITNSMKFPDTITSDWKVLGGLQSMKRTLWQIAIMLKHSTSSATQTTSSSSVPSMSTRDLTSLPTHLFQPIKSVLLYGPPGCGKSATVQGLAKRLGWPVLSITPGSIFRKYVGETSQMTQATFSLLKKTKHCILFIDEVDALFRTRNDLQHQVDRNFLNEFMQMWDGLIQETNTVPILVIGATNRPQDLDPAIQRRFERSFMIGLPTEMERKAIVKTILAGIEKESGLDYEEIAKLTNGFNSNDLLNLCKAAVMIPVMERKRSLGKESPSPGVNPVKTTRPLKIEDIREALASFSPSTWNCKAYGDSISPEREDSGTGFPDHLPFDALSNHFNFPPTPPSTSFPSASNSNSNSPMDETVDEEDDDEDDEDEQH